MLTAALMRLWKADFSLPFDYGGDASYALASIKNVIEHFWYDTNPHLAAPLGAKLYDFPALAGDNLQLALMKVISLGSSNAPTVMNVFYVLTFPLVSLTAYLVFAHFGLTKPTAAACAVLFAFIPFHFLRAEFHLTYSAYYGVPISGYLILSTLGGRSLFSRRDAPGRRWARWLSRRTVGTVLLCGIVGTASDYYAFFGVLIIAMATPLAALRSRRPAILASGAAVIAVIGATVVVDYSPSLVYQAINGVDPQIVQRSPTESEVYSLRLIQLVLPNSLDRIPGVGSADANYNINSVIGANESTSASLGIVGTVGFIWLLTAAGLGVLGVPEGPLMSRLTRDASLATVLAFLIGTTGGIGALFSFLVNPDIRAYNRISPFLSFFGLLGIGVLLDGLSRHAARHAWWRASAPAITLFVAAVGIYEEAPLTAVPSYAAAAAGYNSDDRFVHAIQHAIGPHAAVFELPYERLPAVTQGEGAQYANLAGYIHSSSLTWSYGSLPGRPEDWQSSLVPQPLSRVLPALVAGGFSGIQIDRPAYVPAQLAPLLGALGSLPHNNGFTSPDGRFSFFDLSAYAQQLKRRLGPRDLATLRTATLHPLTLSYGAGFFGPDVPGPDSPRWMGRSAVLTIANPAGRSQAATFSATLETGHDSPYVAEIVWPGGVKTVLRVTAKGTAVTRALEVPSGISVVRFSTNAPPAQDAPGDTRVVNLHISHQRLLDSGEAHLLGPQEEAFGTIGVLGASGLLS